MIDELTILRQARPETHLPDPLVALKARRALLRRALAGRTRRRYAIRSLAGFSAAAVVLGIVGVVNVGGHPTGVNSAAAAVLDHAAEVALQDPTLVAGPGQYVRTTLVEQSWSDLSNRAGDTRIGNDGKPTAFLERWIRELWIPHDPDALWTIREKTERLKTISTDPLTQFAPEPSRTYSLLSWADKASRGNGGSYIKTYDPDWYATLPRDPVALVARLRNEDPGESGSSLHFYFDEVFSEVLRSGIAPPDIRAALFKALAATPGMKVVNGVSNLAGEPGVAIGYGKSGKQMLFDRTTGRYIGERQTNPNFPDVPGLDKAKTTWLTSVHSEIVDTVPPTTEP